MKVVGHPQEFLHITLIALLLLGIFFVYSAVPFHYQTIPLGNEQFLNEQSQALLDGRLNIEHPSQTRDLSFYEGKWYSYYGVLPVFVMAGLQVVLETPYIPVIFLNIALGFLNALLMYLLFEQFRQEFFPDRSFGTTLSGVALFAFGTVHFWIVMQAGTWATTQLLTFLCTTAGLIFVLKNERSRTDYALSFLFISLALLGRHSAVLLLSVPVSLFVYDLWNRKQPLSIRSFPLIFPLLGVFIIFAIYNFARFGNVFETGHAYQNYNPYLAPRYERSNGTFDIRNIPTNLRYLAFEVPSFDIRNGAARMLPNPEGNSIFFLTPPLLAMFLTIPRLFQKKKDELYAVQVSLWLGVAITLIPILLVPFTGWVQFGYRYTLDITALLLLLAYIGINWKPRILFTAGIFLAILFQSYGAWFY